MKSLKISLLYFAVVDFLIFITSQADPQLVLKLLPQFSMGKSDQDEQFKLAYVRLVGILFLSLGISRFFGAVYMTEKGIVEISMLSWIVELTYVGLELARDTFRMEENVATLVLAPLMLLWSALYYTRNFYRPIKQD